MTDNSDKQVLATGKYIRMMRNRNWEYVERYNICGIVGITAVTDEGKLLLVEQYRPPVDNYVIELPAGLAGDTSEYCGEDLADAARRELMEETGYSASRMTFICEGPPSAGISGEIITLYLAEGLQKVGPGGGDHTEDLKIHEVPVDEVHQWLEEKRKSGVLIDLRIYTGLYFIHSCLAQSSR
ncbi:MAG: NUDIX hydrolase [Armatimonadota bacterium]